MALGSAALSVRKSTRKPLDHIKPVLAKIFQRCELFIDNAGHDFTISLRQSGEVLTNDGTMERLAFLLELKAGNRYRSYLRRIPAFGLEQVDWGPPKAEAVIHRQFIP